MGRHRPFATSSARLFQHPAEALVSCQPERCPHERRISGKARLMPKRLPPASSNGACANGTPRLVRVLESAGSEQTRERADPTTKFGLTVGSSARTDGCMAQRRPL